jgi:hypothetical protein
VQGSRRRVMLHTGTRPGDPLADLVFSLAFVPVQEDILSGLRSLGLVHSIDVLGDGAFSVSTVVSVVEVLPPTFMDDMVVPIFDEDPFRLLDKVANAMQVILESCVRFGLEVNFAPGKSEALVALHGKGASACRQSMVNLEAADSNGVLATFLCLPGGQKLRIVKRYKHLGALVHAGLDMSPEVSFKCASSSVAATALSRPCLKQVGFPVQTRKAVALACCQSRLMYLAGTWGSLSVAVYRRFEAACFKPYRAMLGVHGPPAEGCSRVSNDTVRLTLGLAHPLWHLVAAQLRAAARISRSSLRYVAALLQGPGGKWWRKFVGLRPF